MWILLAMLIVSVNASDEYGCEVTERKLISCNCDDSGQYTFLDTGKRIDTLSNTNLCKYDDPQGSLGDKSPIVTLYGHIDAFKNCRYIDLSMTKRETHDNRDDMFDEIPQCDSTTHTHMQDQSALTPITFKIRCPTEGAGWFLSEDGSCKQCFDFNSVTYPDSDDGRDNKNYSMRYYQASCRTASPSCPPGRTIKKIKDWSYVKKRHIPGYQTLLDKYLPGYQENQEDWGEQYACVGGTRAGYTSRPEMYGGKPWIPIDSYFRRVEKTCPANTYSTASSECMDCPSGYITRTEGYQRTLCVEETEEYKFRYKVKNGCD